METKQIIAIMAILAIAVAGIGAAYAYTAQLENTDNSAPAEYLALSVIDGDGQTGTLSETDYKQTFKTADSAQLRYNTVTNWGYISSTEQNKSQVIDYVPALGATPGTAIADLDGQVAVQIGKTLDLNVDSSLMGAGKGFTFSVDTKDANAAVATLSTEGAFVMLYEVKYTPTGGSEVSYKGYKALDSNSEQLFFLDAKNAAIDVKLSLYAVEVKKATFILLEDLQFDGITFAFKAEVDETLPTTMGTLTINTMNAADTAAVMDVDSVKLFTSGGAQILVEEDGTHATGAYVYKVPQLVGMTFEVKKAYNVMNMGDAYSWSSDVATVTYTADKIASLTLVNPPAKLKYTTDSGQTIDWTGAQIQVKFGTNDSFTYLNLTVDDIGATKVVLTPEANWNSQPIASKDVKITMTAPNGQATGTELEFTLEGLTIVAQG